MKIRCGYGTPVPIITSEGGHDFKQNCQLTHLWAEQYDRYMKDIFTVQDNISMQILKALQTRLTGGPTGIKAESTHNLLAYLKFLEAVFVFNKFTRDGNVKSQIKP
jgi:adenylate cyclase